MAVLAVAGLFLSGVDMSSNAITKMLWTVFLACLLGGTLSGLPQLSIEQGELPEDLSQETRDCLSPSVYKVNVDSDLNLDFWFRQDIASDDQSPGGLGINFGALKVGEFIGVVRISGTWRDYKDTALQGGVYTLRYAAQPVDGDHTGVSFYRDFLILSRAGEDREPGTTPTIEELVVASRPVSGTTHPAVMALFPVWDVPEKETVVANEMDQPTLVIKRGDLVLGIVLSGHGEIQGY